MSSQSTNLSLELLPKCILLRPGRDSNLRAEHIKFNIQTDYLRQCKIKKFESYRSHKASFCLEDTECLPGRRQKYDCKTEQAISPGCADIYVSGIDCQVSPKIECKSIKIILHAFKVPKNLRSFSEPLATTSTGILAHVLLYRGIFECIQLI